MSDAECKHGFAIAECAPCGAGSRPVHQSPANRVGHEKWLVFCPAITDDSLLHFNRQGDSYRLRAYVGRLAGRREWVQPDAPTSADFLRTYAPEPLVDAATEQVSVDRADRWAAIISAHNERLGIGVRPSS
jgi:hypothetical protein